MKHLTLDQVNRVVNSPTNLRDRLLLTLTYGCGMRVSEVIALTPVRVKHGHLLMKPGKGGKMTVQRLAPDTLDMWRVMVQGKGAKELVFGVSRQWAHEVFHEACRAAGVELGPRMGIHTLRHSIAHHMLDAGAPLPVVQRKLGHQSIGTTGMYLTADDEDVNAWSAKVLEERT